MKKQGILFFLVSGISLVCLFVLRFILGGWVQYLWIPLAFFIIFLGAGLWTYRHLYKEFFSVRTTKEGMSMGTVILLTLILLIAVNYLGAKKYKTFDFSATKINTLSDQSRTLLKGLKEDLKVLYFYKQGTEGVEENRRAFIDLIRKYQDESALVKLQFVEVNENPKLAEEYGVNKGSGLVFVDYQGRRNKIEKIDEQELTGALVKVTREKDKKIYYLVGHRERDFDDAREATGMNAFKKLLEGNRYLVNPLNLNAVPEIPADADLVMIVGPEQDYLDREVKAIESYLKKGGNLLLALDSKIDPGLKKLLVSLGVDYNPQYVAQVMNTPIGKAVNPQATPANSFSSTEAITKPFGHNEFVVTRLPGILKKGSGVSGVSFDELVRTDQNSMAFATPSFQGEGQPGPFVIGALVKGKLGGAGSKDFQAVIYSDADFLSNQLLYKNLNRDLALNSISYLAKEENIISITPKEVDVTQIQMNETQFYLFIFGFIIPLPLLLIIASGTLWYRRRYA
ncbi:MAG: gliding motility ABC transporter [Bdellovibrio sp. CG10_big_fil_rev_8_21_14_0_10_47_8]|nr:MAG: gliding motility ABC transporter [Bdellovibrio sp. CG10_big_fil_rev_8_21_14_0_10_47_8]